MVQKENDRKRERDVRRHTPGRTCSPFRPALEALRNSLGQQVLNKAIKIILHIKSHRGAFGKEPNIQCCLAWIKYIGESLSHQHGSFQRKQSTDSRKL